MDDPQVLPPQASKSQTAGDGNDQGPRSPAGHGRRGAGSAEGGRAAAEPADAGAKKAADATFSGAVAAYFRALLGLCGATVAFLDRDGLPIRRLCLRP
jgi:hypothetical protein